MNDVIVFAIIGFFAFLAIMGAVYILFLRKKAKEVTDTVDDVQKTRDRIKLKEQEMVKRIREKRTKYVRNQS